MGEAEAKEVMVDVGAVGVEGGFSLEDAVEHDSEGVEDGDEECRRKRRGLRSRAMEGMKKGSFR